MSRYYVINGDDIWYYGFKPKNVAKKDFLKSLKRDWQIACKNGEEPVSLKQIKNEFDFDVRGVHVQELNNSFYIKTLGVKIEDFLENC